MIVLKLPVQGENLELNKAIRTARTETPRIVWAGNG